MGQLLPPLGLFYYFYLQFGGVQTNESKSPFSIKKNPLYKLIYISTQIYKYIILYIYICNVITESSWLIFDFKPEIKRSLRKSLSFVVSMNMLPGDLISGKLFVVCSDQKHPGDPSGQQGVQRQGFRDVFISPPVKQEERMSRRKGKLQAAVDATSPCLCSVGVS